MAVRNQTALQAKRTGEQVALSLGLSQCLVQTVAGAPAARLRGGQHLVVVAGNNAGRAVANEPLTDLVLVERAQRGDAIAFSELVTRHYRRAVRVAYGLLKNSDDAEDVVQDAFARVHQRLSDFAGASAFYTWLYRIVVNLSIDALRKRQRERRVDLEAEAAREALRSSDELWPRYDDSQPLEAAERRQLGARLQQAFAELPEIHQAVILLRELEGMSYEEIAQTLRIKKGTVMSRLFHARRAMQTNLQGQKQANPPADSEGTP